MRTRVKICGITRVADALAAASAGADAVGLVFHADSPRAVTPHQAQRIAAALPPFVTRVGLFVDAAPDDVEAIVSTVGIDLIQYHGDETPQRCADSSRPWIKAVRMHPDVDLERVAHAYQQASMLLLDAYRPGVPGGTGASFDWDRVPRAMAPNIILAGGLRPDNVAAAVRQLAPYAVDVSGGVERSKGIKDHDKIKAFMAGVQLGSTG